MYPSLMLLGVLAGSALSQTTDTPSATTTTTMTTTATGSTSTSTSSSSTTMMTSSLSTNMSTMTSAAPTTVTAIFLPGSTFSPTMNMNGTYQNGTWPLPAVTYIYWEESCSCHQTSSCAASAIPKSMSTTTVTYSEAACGCTTTVAAPCAETVIPVAKNPTVAPVAPAATSSVVISMSSPVAPVVAKPTSTSAGLPTSVYTGAGAGRTVLESGVAFLAVAAALVLA